MFSNTQGIYLAQLPWYCTPSNHKLEDTGRKTYSFMSSSKQTLIEFPLSAGTIPEAGKACR